MSPRKLPTPIIIIESGIEIKPSFAKVPTKRAMVPPGNIDPIIGKPSAKEDRKTSTTLDVGDIKKNNCSI